MSGREAYAILLPLIRRTLWAPDGKPPEGWDERREGSVLKRLLVHRSVSQIEAAIIGLAGLRDTCQVEWLKPGDKVTTRALYNTRSGVSQVFELATAWFFHENRKKPRTTMRTLGGILDEAIRRSRGAA